MIVINDDGECEQIFVHPLRCDTCAFFKTMQCPIQNEDVYYKLKEEVSIPRGVQMLTGTIGCASHSARDKD